MSTIQSREVLLEVSAERERQDAKWGEQNHPNGTHPESSWAAGLASFPSATKAADFFKRVTDLHAERDECTYLDILLEEVAEAFAESDPVKLRAELVQVAAVAVAWVEKIDRDESKATS